MLGEKETWEIEGGGGGEGESLETTGVGTLRIISNPAIIMAVETRIKQWQ